MIVKPLERLLSDVRRWGIVRTIRTQSVAEHSFWVAIWVPRLLRTVGVNDPVVLLAAVEYALTHDMEEVTSGDIATPFKSRLNKVALHEAIESFGLSASPRLAGLPEADMIKAAVKVIDLFEACAFLAEDSNLGNNRNKNILMVIKRKLDVVASEFQRSYGAEATRQGIDVCGYLKEQLRLMEHEWADPLEEIQ
jgi:5'-deoxynucleotidase YfbR-like HD superfamily hydrolase